MERMMKDLHMLQAFESARRLQLLESKITGVVGTDLASSPAWNILLHLYGSTSQRLDVLRIAQLLCLPETTTLRWVSILMQKQLVVCSDETDTYSLTADTERNVTNLLAQF
jgi:hypothetical protein